VDNRGGRENNQITELSEERAFRIFSKGKMRPHVGRVGD